MPTWNFLVISEIWDFDCELRILIVNFGFRFGCVASLIPASGCNASTSDPR
ncbi:hypothetical protein SLEP1_g51805 [Rubroshorea leprosula]|uniref:Uncharacterized protein n=1 Tax=Rubroshorea leprosula TaxID=152421 RepID=A0AAV5M6X9_9ROSI|nr:hypothetical protein SLEP1_g51805 [Rubroshorea leprosula]